MSLKYEPSSEPLHISAKLLFLKNKTEHNVEDDLRAVRERERERGERERRDRERESRLRALCAPRPRTLGDIGVM